MSPVDVEEGRRLLALTVDNPDSWSATHDCDNADAFGDFMFDNAAAMFDAIETGRQWKTVAELLADCTSHADHCPRWEDSFDLPCVCGIDDLLAAFRDVADRTPGPHHDGGAG